MRASGLRARIEWVEFETFDDAAGEGGAVVAHQPADGEVRTMWNDFKAFLTRTNALALAIGVIIGVALGTVVKSIVDDIIMPPIGYLLGGVDFQSLKIVLQKETEDKAEVAIRYGITINTIITFVIVALVVFWIARAFLKPGPEAPIKTCPFCKEPNAEDATKCRACASAI